MAGRFTVEGVIKARDRFTRPMRKMDSAVSRFTRRARKGLRQLDRAFGKVSQGIRRGGVMIAGAMVAAGFAIRNVVQSGMEFEQAITDVGAVSLKTREDIAALEEAALSLGATTKFTATEAANAMEVMARAGFTNAQILSGIGGVLAGAAASGEELADVAGIVSDAMKGMGLAAVDAATGLSNTDRIVDVLALASSKTKSTMGSLGESLSKVASTARRLGIPLEQVVASVALLQDSGLDASVAGSAMDTMLTKLSKPSKAVTKQMEDMDVKFQDAKGNMLDFPVVLANISSALEQSGGNMKQVAFLADLVGLRGQKAAGQLATMFESGKLPKLVAQLEEARGSAQKMADLRMDTLQGDMTLLDSAIDGVKVSLFNLEGGPLRGVVQGMTEWVTANKDLITGKVGEFIKNLIDNFDEIVSVLKKVAIGIAIFQAMAIAVKAAQLATAIFQGTLIAITAVQKIYTLSVAAYTTVVKLSRLAMMLFTTQTLSASLAQKALGASTVTTSLSLAGMRGALNASKLGGAINGITGKLGKAGLLGAALAVGVGMGTWLDHQFGISDMISKWSIGFDGLSHNIIKVGKLLGLQSLVDIGKGALAFDAAERDQSGQTSLGPGPANDSPGSSAGAGVSAPEERAARLMGNTISETMSTERSMTDVTIRDETGRAEVTRQSGRGAPLKIRNTGNFK